MAKKNEPDPPYCPACTRESNKRLIEFNTIVLDAFNALGLSNAEFLWSLESCKRTMYRSIDRRAGDGK